MRVLVGLIGLALGCILIADKSNAAETLEPIQALAQAKKYEEAYQLLLQKPKVAPSIFTTSVLWPFEPVT